MLRSGRNKYKRKKTEVDGILFDSKKEANRYSQLKTMEDLHLISNLRLQVPFELIPSQYEEYTDEKGRKKRRCIERPVKYIADFVYFDGEKEIVEDTKGMRTTDYIIKRKLMLYIHGIRVKEV